MTSAFNWRTGTPSIFASDARFTTLSSGKSRQQTTTEAVERKTKKTGRNPGTIRGISRADKAKASPKAYAKRSGVQ
jgi:hypothetical protein